MGWITDVLKEVPLSAVLKERLTQKEAEHKDLKADHGKAQAELVVLRPENQVLKARVVVLEAENLDLRAKNEVLTLDNQKTHAELDDLKKRTALNVDEWNAGLNALPNKRIFQ